MEKKPNLLLVEDDLTNQMAFRSVLSRSFNMVICKNENEFNVALKKEQFDIFLIDLALQGTKDGIALIQDLRCMKRYETTPIVVVTAHASSKDERNAVNAGATKFLRKPIDNKLLIEQLLELMNFPDQIK